MKIKWKTLLICIGIPLAVGGISALLTRGSMEGFQSLNKPPLSPPAWLFPVAWTILYTLMGISSYLVLAVGMGEERRNALEIYGVQLVVNVLWPVFFFSFQWYLFSLLWLLLLLGLVVVMVWRFWNITKPAAYLNVPYLLWLLFAAYLNWGIWRLNS